MCGLYYSFIPIKKQSTYYYYILSRDEICGSSTLCSEFAETIRLRRGVRGVLCIFIYLHNYNIHSLLHIRYGDEGEQLI